MNTITIGRKTAVLLTTILAILALGVLITSAAPDATTITEASIGGDWGSTPATITDIGDLPDTETTFTGTGQNGSDNEYIRFTVPSGGEITGVAATSSGDGNWDFYLDDAPIDFSGAHLSYAGVPLLPSGNLIHGTLPGGDYDIYIRTQTASAPADWSVTITATLPAPSCYTTIDEVTVYSSADSQAVRDAVTAATAGDVIKIAGTCTGVDTNYLADISTELTLQGGYTNADWNTYDPVNNVTILDADSAGGVLKTTEPITINGLTLQHGLTGIGGALYSSNDVVIQDSTFYSNTATTVGSTGGGALHLTSSTVTIDDTTFTENHAYDHGGAIFMVTGDSIALTNVDFYSNTATLTGGAARIDVPMVATGGVIQNNRANTGGGMMTLNSSVAIDNVSFDGNTSLAATGGALYFDGGTIANSQFENNDANTLGGAIHNTLPMTVTNSNFISNTAAYGGAIHALSDATLTITDSDIISNTASSSGGGIYSDASLNLDTVLLQENRSEETVNGFGGSAIWATSSVTMNNADVIDNYAGMDYTIAAFDSITVTNSLFQGNVVKDDAAGIQAFASAHVADTDFIENSSDGSRGTTGDGVMNIVGDATLTNTNFIRNSFTNGGGTLRPGGTTTIANSQFISNTVSGAGAAIYNLGALTIDTIEFTENAAANGGAIYNTGTVTATNGTFTENSASSGAPGGGGAIFNASGTVAIETSFFDGNFTTAANGDGGAIFSMGSGTLDIDATTFSNNHTANEAATEGGAIIIIETSTLAVTNSTFADNFSPVGSAITLWAGAAATVENSTFYGNDGASTLFNNMNADVINSTFSDNVNVTNATLRAGGTLNMVNSIVANTTGGGADCVGTLATNTNNLIEDGTCSPAVSGAPLLGTLEYTGLGNTGVLPLLTGSPAIDAGDDASAPAIDQRGISRPQGCAADMGAYEVEGTCGPALSLEKTAVNITGDPLIADDIIEYVVTVTNELDSSQAGIVITDAIPASTTYVAGSAAVSQGSVSGPDPLVANIGTLAANASATLTFRVTVDEDAVGETIQNSAQASSPDQPEPVEVGPIEPDGGGLVLPSADLAISQSIELVYLQTIFTIEVDNNGPDAAPGTVVSVTFPVEITAVTWTCVGSGGAVCPAASGSGNIINETVATFPADGNLTYTVDTTPPWEPITNLAEVIPASDVVDPDMTNNQSEQVTSYKVLLPLVFKN